MAKGTLSIAGADTLTAADLAPNSVDTSELAADAVTGAKIEDNAVDSEHIAADSIDAEHYAAGSVDSTAIAVDAVLPANIAYLGDGTGKLSGTITGQQLRLGTAFTLTDDLTVNGDLTLSKVRADGTGQSLTQDSSANRTITGTGTIRMGHATEKTSIAGFTGVLDEGVTVRMKYATDNTRYAFAPGGNTWAEMSTNLRISIQGASTSNKFLMRMDLPVSEGGTGNIWMFKFWNVTTGSIVTPYGTTGYLSGTGANHECHYAHRGSHSDTNDSDLLTYTLVGDIPNTNLNTYTIYGLCQTAQTFYVNYQHNGGNDTYSWTAISNFVIQEIAG